MPSIKLYTDESNNHKVFVDGGGNIKLYYTQYENGLSGIRYDGYFNDDLNWFDTAPLHGDTNILSSIDNFTSSADDYSWKWTGYFKPSSSELYTFYTYSDDASYLFISDILVVDNGGAHGPTEQNGSISLTADTYYPITILFGESGGGDIMTVSFSTDTISKTTNGSGYYFH